MMMIISMMMVMMTSQDNNTILRNSMLDVKLPLKECPSIESPMLIHPSK